MALVNPERAAVIATQVERGAPTFTGKFIDPHNLSVEDIDLRDIAHHLSLANRYMGATDVPYSVAQHSVLVARVCFSPKKRAGLFHDAGEAYFGDLSRVIKYHADTDLGALYRAAEDKAARVIEQAFDFDPMEFEDAEVKWADDLIGDLEWNCLIERTGDDIIIPWSAARAEQKFLDAAYWYC